MKVKKPGIWSILLVFLVITSIMIILFIPYRQALVFEYQNTGDVLAFIPLPEQGKFKMKYTHSIHLSEVVESYTINENHEIKQYELMYEDFAIGMPENAADGEVFEQKNGKYYIKNMNRVFPYFDLRVGKVRANHTIIFKNNEYPLSQFVEPGTWIRIGAEKLNLFQVLKGVNMLGG
ncbi:DUF1850 domain-containing protein [Bacillus mesophilum]|uniref:DUF1850 domain-containing protein n=1 Tax=Bacillus mesophilum TaxID=1071718 RepID=A0A7V7RP80_9BACI|nr:DUF1850 domain-containing protein [Bacillus mesophilum]KAB2335040.1 DUF1850 domain-containing protein [Bacillus mesophilum]